MTRAAFLKKNFPPGSGTLKVPRVTVVGGRLMAQYLVAVVIRLNQRRSLNGAEKSTYVPLLFMPAGLTLWEL
jgi:hypothetical protein